MRFCNLILWDMKFQARYGFYLLYGFLTLLYAALLFSFPEAWKEKAAAILIFSDPAAMGLFFMGAVVLLEKSQRVTSFFAVSPLSVIEYIWSKTLALNIIALVVAAVLAVSVNSRSILLVLLGTFLSGILFTLLGIISVSSITKKPRSIDKNKQKWYNRSARKIAETSKKACTSGGAYV